LNGVLGTVAGDDTLFLAIDQETDAAAVAAIIEGE
jgi:arginine repressor